MSGGIIGGVIATVLLIWLAGRAKKEAVNRSGRFVLEYGRAVKVLGWVLGLFGVGMLFVAPHASKDQTVIAWVVCGALFAAGACLLAEFHLVRIEFDEEFIYTFSPWRRSRIIPWNEVIDSAYSGMNRWHILKTQKSGSVRLSVLLSGLGTMANRLAEKSGIILKEASL